MMRALLVAALSIFAAPAEAKEGRLVVVVVVDQLASEIWLRGEPLFDGGFARLMARGAVFPNGVHAQANTATGPGHATLVTGSWPSVHGIVSNVWFDAKGARVYCVDDPVHGSSPKLMMAPTLGDQLRVSTGGRGRVVSLALKDRVAILMGGDAPSAAIWWDPKSGSFVRGRYAETKALAAMDAANEAHRALAAANAPWERLRPELDYARHSGADDLSHEGDIAGLGRAFPHAYGAGTTADAYRVSPRILDALVELATRTIDELELGRRGETDLLLVGLTTLDYAGHFWGPASQEALDVLLRTDRALGALMSHAERAVGKDRVWWALSGDHGVTPSPEVAGGNAARVDGKAMITRVNAALAPLAAKGKPPTTVALFDPPFVWLTHADPSADRLALRRAAAKALRAEPELIDARAAEDVAAFDPAFAPLFRRTLYPGREADVLILQRPNDLIEVDYHTGSGHGSPYTYDTHVPILVAGPGIRPKRDVAPYEVTRLAPTVAAMLGTPPPGAALEPPLPAF